jgi:hypothetical protein
MKADLRAELGLVNRNVYEVIRLLECAIDAGVWTRQEATWHEKRLELLRAKLNADFSELMVLRERANKSRPSMPKYRATHKKIGFDTLAATQTYNLLRLYAVREEWGSRRNSADVGMVSIKSESTR